MDTARHPNPSTPMLLVLRFLFRSVLLAAATRLLGRFFPVLLRLLRVLLPR